MVRTDFAGNVYTMEAYDDLTTNTTGEVTVTLLNEPVSDKGILVNLQGAEDESAQFSSRSGSAVTFKTTALSTAGVTLVVGYAF